MRMHRSARWLMLTLFFSLIPASLHAQVVISVGFAPPELPVYEQPYCPEPNLIWMPGYWAYDLNQGDYYWVPGAWVEAPYEGALWTPDYWDWSGGRYRFHRGYWGRHVGYYGGVDYGFGYGGIGYSGGEWQGNSFRYNTAVTRVDQNRIHNTYSDRTIVENNTIANRNRVSYNGGPGGIQHKAQPSELVAAHEQHAAPTRIQTQHIATARTDKTSFAKANGGHPHNAAVARPMAPVKSTPAQQQQSQTQQRQQTQQKQAQTQQHQKAEQQQVQTQQRQQVQQKQAQTQQHQKAEQQQARTQQRQKAQQQQARPAPQQQSRPAQQQQARPAPQQQSRPAQQQQARPAPQQQTRPAPQQQTRPAPQQQARPAPQQQSRPAQQQQAPPRAESGPGNKPR